MSYLSPSQAMQRLFVANRQAQRLLERGHIGMAQTILCEAEEAVEPAMKDLADAHAEFAELMGPLPACLAPVNQFTGD